jgi:predicted permease
LGQFLFWLGVPISVIAFLRGTDLSGGIWIAPVIAWVAILLGAGWAWLLIKLQEYWQGTVPRKSTQGSFILAAMVGNTGYLGFPVTLAVVGKQYFAWALFYDLLGTMLGAYILGVAIAARCGDENHSQWQTAKAILINPTLWSFFFGLWFRQVTLAPIAEWCLDKLAWFAVALSLVLIGMRLSKLTSWRSLPWAGISLSIKMLLVPLVLGSSLSVFGVTGTAAQVMVLQMAMPPAFATLVIAETYNLDRDLAVTALAVGCLGLLVTLPVWLWWF